jgi:hypothetical protein
MEAFTDTARVEPRPTGTTPWKSWRSWCSVLARVLADGARDDSLDRLLTNSSSASFATLPRGQQDRLLNQGFRPSN